MFDTLGRSWALMGESWAVLRQERSLLFFPILSGIASILVLASFTLPVVGILGLAGLERLADQGAVPVWFYPLTFLFYLVSYFVVVFFNTGLVACVRLRFAGETPTLRDGLSFALENLGIIFQWALLSATVSVLLRALEHRFGWLGTLVVQLIGIGWALATMFVVPVLVHERVGPFQALKRSAQTFRQTWGEAVVGNFGLNLIGTLLGIAGFMLIVGAAGAGIALFGATPAAWWIFGGGGLALGVLFLVGVGIVQAALQGIFLTACYQYATTGQVPTAFTAEFVTQAWVPIER